jgi:D-glycero-alpha-D-manno-heptose-7-phosphate kinase
MVTLAHQLRDELQFNNLDAFGEILHENWMLKKELTKGISNGDVDCWYARGRGAGAQGGKLLGAGAGGFLMLFAPSQCHGAITEVLSSLRQVDIRFEPRGSRILLYQP